MEIKNWLPIEFNLALITITLCSTTNGKSYSLIYTSIKSWNNPGDISLSGNCASVVKSDTHHSEKHQPPDKTKTNHH